MPFFYGAVIYHVFAAAINWWYYNVWLHMAVTSLLQKASPALENHLDFHNTSSDATASD